MPSKNELVRKLYDVATCRVPHVYNGQCPDSMEGSDVRDADCPACQILIDAGRQLGVPNTGTTNSPGRPAE